MDHDRVGVHVQHGGEGGGKRVVTGVQHFCAAYYGDEEAVHRHNLHYSILLVLRDNPAITSAAEVEALMEAKERLKDIAWFRGAAPQLLVAAGTGLFDPSSRHSGFHLRDQFAHVRQALDWSDDRHVDGLLQVHVQQGLEALLKILRRPAWMLRSFNFGEEEAEEVRRLQRQQRRLRWAAMTPEQREEVRRLKRLRWAAWRKKEGEDLQKLTAEEQAERLQGHSSLNGARCASAKERAEERFKKLDPAAQKAFLNGHASFSAAYLSGGRTAAEQREWKANKDRERRSKR
jgi:hypothetical protein